MRWIWIDRFVEFDSGRYARAIKNVSLAEEQVHDHFPGCPMLPHSLILEGLAQTGGLLVGEVNGFREKVVLAKLSKAVFHGWAVPGDTLTYETTIEYVKPDGAMVAARATIGERPLCEAEIVFAHLASTGRELFDQQNFVFTLKLLGVFDVGRQADGSRLIEPPGLARLAAVQSP